MPRIPTHARETVSRNMVKSKIDSYYKNGDALVRSWSENDYGIDAVLELFDNGYPTGKLAFLQIKGTIKTIKPLTRGPLKNKFVSCGNVSSSTLEYAHQDIIPMILIYASVGDPNCFYYVDLQSQISDIESRAKDEGQSEHTVHIPIQNYVESDLSGLFNLVQSYYNR